MPPFGFEQKQILEKKVQEQSFKNYEKRYVSVQCLQTTNAEVIPQLIMYDSYHKYEIDKVIDVRKAASLKAGGTGTRYTVRIMNKETYLFFDECERKWFVEKKVK